MVALLPPRTPGARRSSSAAPGGPAGRGGEHGKGKRGRGEGGRGGIRFVKIPPFTHKRWDTSWDRRKDLPPVPCIGLFVLSLVSSALLALVVRALIVGGEGEQQADRMGRIIGGPQEAPQPTSLLLVQVGHRSSRRSDHAPLSSASFATDPTHARRDTQVGTRSRQPWPSLNRRRDITRQGLCAGEESWSSLIDLPIPSFFPSSSYLFLRRVRILRHSFCLSPFTSHTPFVSPRL